MSRAAGDALDPEGAGAFGLSASSLDRPTSLDHTSGLAALVWAAVNVLGVRAAVDPRTAGTIHLGLGAGAFLFVLLRLATATSFTKFGLYVALVLGAVLAYGGVLKYRQVARA